MYINMHNIINIINLKLYNIINIINIINLKLYNIINDGLDWIG